MVTIKTSKRHTYTADYCGVGYMGWLKMQIQDSRALDVLAREFTSLSIIKAIQDSGETETFENFSILHRVELVDDYSIVILLAKEDTHNGTV